MKHHYAPDSSGGTDHRGRWPCLHCPLPPQNQIHQNVPEDEVSARVMGEEVTEWPGSGR